MADNFTCNSGSGGITAAADDIGGVHYTRVKPSWGVDGSAVDASVTNPLPVQIIGQAAGGTTTHRLISAATTNATSVKASAGTIYMIYATNINAAVRYLKLYNKASSPTVGTDTPTHTFLIPASATGAGFWLNIPQGIAFATGIALALTTGIADANTGAVAADEIIVTTQYV